MKYIKMILLVLPMLGLISCVKQKNCEEGEIGIFQYYIGKPTVEFDNCFIKEDAKAVLYNLDTNAVMHYIAGSVPSEYKSGKLIKVRVWPKRIDKKERDMGPCGSLYKLTCIEKED